MKNKFRLRVHELRNKLGITQKELGERLKLTDSTINNYESGKRQPPYDTLIKLAEFFGATTDYLIGKDDEWKRSLPADLKDFVLNPDNETYLGIAKEALESGISHQVLAAFIEALVRQAKDNQ